MTRFKVGITVKTIDVNASDSPSAILEARRLLSENPNSYITQEQVWKDPQNPIGIQRELLPSPPIPVKTIEPDTIG
jgi:hypothetical protein